MAPANKRPSAGSMAPPVSKSGLYAGLASVDRGAEQDSERGPRKPSNPSGPSGSTSRLASANSNAAGGGNRVPSVLRRLPPGAVPRSAVPSLSHTHDGDASLRQPSSSSGSSSSAGTSGGLHGGTRAPAVAALARANQRGPRSSLGASINAAANGAVVQHDRDGREVVKLNVDSTSFEEWMKMATDNVSMSVPTSRRDTRLQRVSKPQTDTYFYTHSLLCRKSTRQTRGTLPLSTTFMICHCCVATLATALSTSKKHPARWMDV